MPGFEINPDICKAHTPPSSFYTDASVFDALKRRAFARSWQLVADADVLKAPGNVYPCNFLDGAIDEPILLTRVSFEDFVEQSAAPPAAEAAGLAEPPTRRFRARYRR